MIGLIFLIMCVLISNIGYHNKDSKLIILMHLVMNVIGAGILLYFIFNASTVFISVVSLIGFLSYLCLIHLSIKDFKLRGGNEKFLSNI